MFYRVLDVQVSLFDKPTVFKYQFKTWNSLISFLSKSIISNYHFVYVSKVFEKSHNTAFHIIHSPTQSFYQTITCYESLNNDCENLWINSKYGDLYENE